MKTSILLLLSYITAQTSAFVPNTHTFTSPTLLRAEAETEAETEEEAPEYKGAQAISGLTAGVSDVFVLEDIAKILPHVRTCHSC